MSANAREIADSVSVSGRAMILLTLPAAVAAILALASGLARGDVRAGDESDSWDFGYLPQKSEVRHIYYLRNDGSGPLTVSRIESGCACTSVSEIDGPVSPGDSVPIAVTFKSGRYHRRVTKVTSVYSDDSGAPIRRLTVSADVVKPGDETGMVSIEPRRLKWRSDRVFENAGSDTLSVVNRSPDSLRAVVLHMPEEIVDRIELPEMVFPGSSASVVLHIRPTPAPGNVRGYSCTLAFFGRDTVVVTIPVETDG